MGCPHGNPGSTYSTVEGARPAQSLFGLGLGGEITGFQQLIVPRKEFPYVAGVDALGLGAVGPKSGDDAGSREASLALLLAIDISGSVDDGEYRLQVDGTADALSDPDIQSALLSGPVTLAVMQWSAVGMQKIVQPWQRMDTLADIERFGAAARIQERAFGKADTAVSDAISAAVA